MRLTKSNVGKLLFAGACFTVSYYLLGLGIVEVKRVLK